MMKRTWMVLVVLSAVALPSGLVVAAEQERAEIQAQTQKQEQVYGSQLMTKQERNEYHARMRAATTAREREQIRLEHHKAMQERARERGVTLPDEPPMGGGGMGPDGGGMGPGGGMGSGSGMGSGGGGRR